MTAGKHIRPYPEYKDSGVDWLGEVPAHWNVTRLGGHFSERREKVSDKEFEPLSVTMQGIMPRLDTAAKTDAGDNRKKVCIGDFVINSRSDRKGSGGVSPLDGSVSLISIVLEPRSLCGSFIHLLLRSQPFQEEFYRYGKGIVADLWSTNYSEMKNIQLALPPLPEQEKIAAFLDYETRGMDLLIEKQGRLIELLKEKRQAVISHAVTKGLDPNAPMKDSGVEWLGEVPEHWKVGKLGFYSSILSGFAFSSSDFTEDTGNTRLLRGVNVGIGQLKWNDVVYWKRSPGDGLGEYELAHDDIVIGMDRPVIGQGVRVARVQEHDVPSLLLQRVASLKPKSDLNPDYVYALLSSSAMFSAHFLPDTTGVSVPHISPTQINDFITPVPPVSEQSQIAGHLRDINDRYTAIETKGAAEIGLLKERRTALISAAVTGKIDLRDWRPPSPVPVEQDYCATVLTNREKA